MDHVRFARWSVYAVAFAVLQEPLEAHGTATAKIRALDSTGAWILTEEIVTVYSPPYFTAAGTIPAQSEIKIERIGGRWYVAAAPCPEEEE